MRDAPHSWLAIRSLANLEHGLGRVHALRISGTDSQYKQTPGAAITRGASLRRKRCKQLSTPCAVAGPPTEIWAHYALCVCVSSMRDVLHHGRASARHWACCCLSSRAPLIANFLAAYVLPADAETAEDSVRLPWVVPCLGILQLLYTLRHTRRFC